MSETPSSALPTTFRIASSVGSYEVLVAQGIFAETMSRVDDAWLLVDDFFRPRFSTFPASPIFVEAHEEAKSLERMPALIQQLRSSGATRSAHLVAIGGGIVQDIAAFIASVYMRGIPWSYNPTTVLSMVDSCIGGKSSINVGPYKNLVGTFHPPDRILIDPAHALTLSASDFASGLVEAAKITFCHSPQAFAHYLDAAPSRTMSVDALDRVILTSLHAKKHFIEKDEFDKRERLLLNFGHTFGHAIEGASHFGIPHGHAVALGILCSLQFQRERGIHFEATRVEELERHLEALLGVLPDLKERLAAVHLDDVLDRFASDKKHSPREFTLILVNEAGEVVLERLERTPAVVSSLRNAIASIIDRYVSPTS